MTLPLTHSMLLGCFGSLEMIVMVLFLSARAAVDMRKRLAKIMTKVDILFMTSPFAIGILFREIELISLNSSVNSEPNA